jgi:putative sigma-54 modulation protein
MRLEVKARNVEVPDGIHEYAQRKLSKLAKRLSEPTRVELELTVERNPSIATSHVAEATVWTKGPVLRAREAAADLRAAIDQLTEKLERQVERYSAKRRHEHERRAASPPVAAPSRGEEEAVIVKTKQFVLEPMSPEEAALQLELVGHDFFVFRNADSGEINVLYRRRDGRYGLIEPA